MCWAPSNTNAHTVIDTLSPGIARLVARISLNEVVPGDFAHKHHFMKVSCSRHATEQHTSQTRTIRASAFYPFNVY